MLNSFKRTARYHRDKDITKKDKRGGRGTFRWGKFNMCNLKCNASRKKGEKEDNKRGFSSKGCGIQRENNTKGG